MQAMEKARIDLDHSLDMLFEYLLCAALTFIYLAGNLVKSGDFENEKFLQFLAISEKRIKS